MFRHTLLHTAGSRLFALARAHQSLVTAASLALLLAAAPLHAQDPAYANRLTVLSGLSQAVVFGGGNAEVRYSIGRLVMEYSHGFSLDMTDANASVSSTDEKEGITVQMPWTTGGGIGYRLTPRLDAVLDFKAHRARVGHPGGAGATYTTYTVGPAFAYTLPLWRNLVIQPVARWWPNIGSSVNGDAVNLRRTDGSSYRHEVIGIGPGGFNANVKLGVRF